MTRLIQSKLLLSVMNTLLNRTRR